MTKFNTPLKFDIPTSRDIWRNLPKSLLIIFATTLVSCNSNSDSSKPTEVSAKPVDSSAIYRMNTAKNNAVPEALNNVLKNKLTENGASIPENLTVVTASDTQQQDFYNHFKKQNIILNNTFENWRQQKLTNGLIIVSINLPINQIPSSIAHFSSFPGVDSIMQDPQNPEQTLFLTNLGKVQNMGKN